ncbi:hypothetical protein SB679_25895, partial [Chryseobacterium sp. SIMBA_029]
RLRRTHIASQIATTGTTTRLALAKASCACSVSPVSSSITKRNSTFVSMTTVIACWPTRQQSLR